MKSRYLSRLIQSTWSSRDTIFGEVRSISKENLESEFPKVMRLLYESTETSLFL
jgi:hypothetical protein